MQMCSMVRCCNVIKSRNYRTTGQAGLLTRCFTTGSHRVFVLWKTGPSLDVDVGLF